MMNLTFYSGFTSRLLREGIQKTAEYAEGLGFSSVEYLDCLPCSDEMFDTLNSGAAEAKRILSSHGLKVACCSVGVNLWGEGGEDNAEKLKRIAERANELECPYLHHTALTWLYYTPDCPPRAEAIDRAAELACRVAAYAKPLGVTCLYEDQGIYINGIEGYGEFYSKVKSCCSNVGVCADIGNIYFGGEEPAPFFAHYASDIKHVHIKDYLQKTTEENPGMYWLKADGCWLRDTMIGSGVIDFASCMKVLSDIGYTGAYALEIDHPEPFEAGVKQAAQYLGRFCK